MPVFGRHSRLPECKRFVVAPKKGAPGKGKDDINGRRHAPASEEGAQMVNRKFAVAVLGVALVAVFAAVSTQAWDASRTNYVKFNRSVALPGVELTAGTYIFELADPSSNQNLVRVLSSDRRHVYAQQFTIPVQRPKNMDENHGITFGEVPAGMAPPVQAWYPSGDQVGHEFMYRR